MLTRVFIMLVNSGALGSLPWKERNYSDREKAVEDGMHYSFHRVTVEWLNRSFT